MNVSQTTATLIGAGIAVAGGIIGALVAAILNARLARQNERHKWEQGLRHTAYADFIATASDTRERWDTYHRAQCGPRKGETEEEHQQRLEMLEQAATATGDKLLADFGRLRLVASPRVTARATLYLDAVRAFAWERSGPSEDTLARTRPEFVDAAQSQLGLARPAQGRWARLRRAIGRG